jgi:NAD-dependent deacetylase sirtuin 4
VAPRATRDGLADEPPSRSDPPSALFEALRGKRIAALTGAGCSTESGIPDYRGPETRRRARSPIEGRAFRDDPAVRRRYWARATLGWARFSGARPGPAHHALAELERRGHLVGVVTQNVDRLHHAAGSERVVELHGALAEVRCLSCGAAEARHLVQARLVAENPGWLEASAELAPDGDAELPRELEARFREVGCLACGGPQKPSVVFFGENVARPVVEAAFALVDEADALLVVGSSLAVFSGYRFLLRAASQDKPVCIVSLGYVRGEERALAKVDGRLGEVLPALVEALGAPPERAAEGIPARAPFELAR